MDGGDNVQNEVEEKYLSQKKKNPLILKYILCVFYFDMEHSSLVVDQPHEVLKIIYFINFFFFKLQTFLLTEILT